jgi:Potential Queuosine, Q, salvage protein family
MYRAQILESLGVLESVEAALPDCQHVTIDEVRLADVCTGIGADDLRLPTWEMPVFSRSSPDALAAQILLFNAVNFCYWGFPKWQVQFGGELWHGSLAMLAAINRAFSENVPLLDAAQLSQLPEDEFDHILRGPGRLHLLPDRLANWRQVGTVLSDRFNGRFTDLIAAGRGDALLLVETLVDYFPAFDDAWPLYGRRVRFYKRAQLAAAMLYEAFEGRQWGELSRTERLTVFADYKLPQVLRGLGILIYSPGLAVSVDGEAPIRAGDPREVEIRVATVWAGELMRRALSPRLPNIAAMQLDYWLWNAGQQQSSLRQPYHRTLTTAY